MISEKRGAFWNPKNQRFHRNRGSFWVKVSDFFNMENTDGLHKFPVSGGTGHGPHCTGKTGKIPQKIPVRENTKNFETLQKHRGFCLLK